MTANPGKYHPPEDEACRIGRRSIRLKGYDYAQEGAYYVTINVVNRECLFGDIIDRTMHLNEYGKIADRCWRSIPDHFPNVELDEFVVMPDHMHGIIVIVEKHDVGSENVGARRAVPLQNGIRKHEQFGKPTRGSLPTIVRSFKSAVSKQINQIWDEPRSHVWQRNYYEHIIRDENELNRIRQYIVENPEKWEMRNKILP